MLVMGEVLSCVSFMGGRKTGLGVGTSVRRGGGTWTPSSFVSSRLKSSVSTANSLSKGDTSEKSREPLELWESVFVEIFFNETVLVLKCFLLLFLFLWG